MEQETAINTAITFLAGKIKGDITADSALKYTQAALNLKHVLAVQSNIEKDNPK